MVGWLRKVTTIALVNTISYSVQSTLSMLCMLYLGGSGGMPPTENFCKFSLCNIEILQYF